LLPVLVSRRTVLGIDCMHVHGVDKKKTLQKRNVHGN